MGISGSCRHGCWLLAGLLLLAPVSLPAADGDATPLAREERVAGHLALERLMHSQGSWDELLRGPRPDFDEAAGRETAAWQAEDTLRMSAALDRLYGVRFSGEELQAELDRMARTSLQPDRLAEYFAVLGNDSHLAAECLARPVLVENTFRERYSWDTRIHGDLRRHAEAAWSTVRAVDDLPGLDGAYSESEWIRATDAAGVAGDEPEPIDGPTYLDGEGWGRLQATLRRDLGQEASSPEQLSAGTVGRLQENAYSFFGVAVLEATATRVRTARVVWPKEDFHRWWPRERQHSPALSAEPEYAYRLPVPGEGAPRRAGGDWWKKVTNTGAPTARSGHEAVWTGSRMLVWGGWDGSTYFSTGGLYNPTTNSWTAINTTGAPLGRREFTVTWLNTMMYVWGGYGAANFDTGATYSPGGAGLWQAFCNTTGPSCNVPDERRTHSMVVGGPAGNHFTIWGGVNSSETLGTGASYLPGVDIWTDTDATDPHRPSARHDHTGTAVYDWTKWYMVVWGGYDRLDTGARLDLEEVDTDLWLPVTSVNDPPGRHGHAAVEVRLDSVTYTGGAMIWGGYTWGANLWSTQGGLYRPFTNQWTILSTDGAPIGRQNLRMVWSGNEVILWGGDQTSTSTDTGGRYNPFTDSWSVTDTSDADTPSARTNHTAVWAETGMIVWGGYDLVDRLGDGAMYYSCHAEPLDEDGYDLAATDADGCSYSGIQVTWDQDVSSWGDYDISADRSYWVLRDGGPLASGGCAGPLAYGTTGCTDDLAAQGTSYDYNIVYVNTCGGSFSAPGEEQSAADLSGSAPVVTASCTVTDLDGCDTTGLEITWPQNPGGGWGDNETGDRRYRVWRWDQVIGWQALGSQQTATSYTDSTTLTGLPYLYKVRYINGCDLTGETAPIGPVYDDNGTALVVSQAAAAIDDDSCTHTGIRVTWPQDPDNWGDGGTGDRFYRVRRSTDGVNFTPIGDNIAYGTTSYLDAGASPDQLTYYQVRYKNGCDTVADSAPDSATDAAASAPSGLTASAAADPDRCVDAGIEVTWAADPEDWGDDGVGTRSYDILRDGTPIATGLAYETTTYTDTTGVNGTGYLYQVRYANGCGLQAATTGDIANDRPTAPADPAQNNTAGDADVCAHTGVLVTWDADPDGTWGDGSGSAGHTYEVLRGGVSLQSGIPYGTTQFTDFTGTPGTAYDYAVRYWNCGGLSSETAGTTADDEDDSPTAPAAPAVEDENPCAQTGMWVTWNAVSGATGYDLLVDGATVVSDVTSPYHVDPGDLDSHTYQVRARTALCAGDWSAATAYADGATNPDAQFCDGFESGTTTVWSQTVP